MLNYAETASTSTNVSPSKETTSSTSPTDVDKDMSLYEIQAIFQQWKMLTLDLAERLVALVGETKEADRKSGKPNLKLRHHRKMRNWTQADLAGELSRLCKPREVQQRGRGMISTGMVSSWERGEHLPSPFWQKKLCMLFDTTPDCLGLL
jgi:DNA-binding transcriptional regulator YiaG